VFWLVRLEVTFTCVCIVIYWCKVTSSPPLLHCHQRQCRCDSDAFVAPLAAAVVTPLQRQGWQQSSVGRAFVLWCKVTSPPLRQRSNDSTGTSTIDSSNSSSVAVAAVTPSLHLWQQYPRWQQKQLAFPVGRVFVLGLSVQTLLFLLLRRHQRQRQH